MKKSLLLLFLICGFAWCFSQDNTRYIPKEYVEITHPEWSKNATIYEVNIRQYTPEGTFKAFEKHLPRLKNMGIDIIWLMPIHPIGEVHRKGKLGSYYSVKDFKGINPEFGTMKDFQHLVDTIHQMGMYVIIDWVGNHSAWDNSLATEHPDWYTKTRDGNFQPTPWYDWDDVIDFDYNNPDFRKYMTGALKYWVEEADIDGYRADVAGFIPVDFWENARTELDAVKPVFMLAEWESRDLYKKSFDMTYSWTLWDKLHNVTQGKSSIWPLVEYLSHDVNANPKNAYRMLFTDNHDKNSWEGNMVKNFGDGLETSMVFCGVANGMSLVYSGQEAGLDRSLAFFEKDLIDFSNLKYEKLYKTLFDLKHQNQALWNGKYGGEMIRVVNNQQEKVISFYRESNGDAVLPIFNFSGDEVTVNLNTQYFGGSYTDLFSGQKMVIKGQSTFKLKPWDYKVLVKD